MAEQLFLQGVPAVREDPMGPWLWRGHKIEQPVWEYLVMAFAGELIPAPYFSVEEPRGELILRQAWAILTPAERAALQAKYHADAALPGSQSERAREFYDPALALVDRVAVDNDEFLAMYERARYEMPVRGTYVVHLDGMVFSFNLRGEVEQVWDQSGQERDEAFLEEVHLQTMAARLRFRNPPGRQYYGAGI